ncbi:MAG: DUF58 domain-containing protein [Bacteriovoracaceae bacterium]|nr:DUF58 domain-containing protein [Bacteriovoracaceae bacterium]
MDIKEIERVVASIQHAVFRNANSVSVGALRSRFKGAGLQFREHQIYAHGDDVRFIDWKLSARSSHIYLKTFEEDRNVEVCVILDINPSSFYGSNGISKIQMMFETCALLYLLAQKTQDQIKVVILCNGEAVHLPPKKGREGLILFVSWLERMSLVLESGKVNLSQQFKFRENKDEFVVGEIKRQLSKRKEIVYLGDFSNISETSDFFKITQVRHFHAVRMISPIDIKPLSFNFATGRAKSAGLASPTKFSEAISKIPYVMTSEKYLEIFLRRLQ